MPNIFSVVFTYWVEIFDPVSGKWNVIHGVGWDSTNSYAEARAYAREVLRDHPRRPVQVVEHAEGFPDHHIPITW